MDLERYLKKQALNQVRFVEEKGAWFLEFDQFDTDTGAPAAPERCPVSLEKLLALRREIVAEIYVLDKTLVQISAVKARQEANLADMDKVFADFQGAKGA